MKFGFSLYILLFSAHSYACFSMVGYEQNWNDSMILLSISFILGILATFIRYIQKIKRLYIPITILVLTSIPASLEILRYGNGDCGIGLLQVAIWPIYIMSLVVLYEVVKLVKIRLGDGNT